MSYAVSRETDPFLKDDASLSIYMDKYSDINQIKGIN